MKLKEWINVNREHFLENDLRFLLKEVCDLTSLSLFLKNDFLLDESALARLEKIKSMYIQGVPLAYLLGKEEFFGFDFYVNEHVFIPRKETELLIEKAVEIARITHPQYILDLCCGSANIAISLKKTLSKEAVIVASDISFAALKVGKRNVEGHHVSIPLLNGDFFNAFKYSSFDLIVSNPPYVGRGAIKDSLQYEPRIALEAFFDGLSVIRKILQRAYCYLKPGGYIIIEMGATHKAAVNEIVADTAAYEIIEWIKDYAGLWRGVVLKTRMHTDEKGCTQI